ncbi:SRPBCC family protein [Bacillus sp. DX3.1]|uniref:CoxG family protein n=1 Tax=Bacillus sp. DX3.1 TaxID=3052091 RepID=UPI00256FEBB6|nr:SRPBCC family protein [Bacillus sp. DX3.1]WJE81608.1 SRPBCC family protein [Bacillus sp. DX3.1]
MAKGTHTMDLYVPLDHTWNFVSDMNNWAPLITGYVAHKIIDDRHSTWRLHGDLGVVKRHINLNVEITEWQEHDKVSFTIASPTKKLIGSGFFRAEAITPSKTRITSELEVKATGKGALIFNGAMKPFVPKMTKKLSKAIASKLVEQE